MVGLFFKCTYTPLRWINEKHCLIHSSSVILNFLKPWLIKTQPLAGVMGNQEWVRKKEKLKRYHLTKKKKKRGLGATAALNHKCFLSK